MSDGEVFPAWMVPNGETWSVSPDAFASQTPRGVKFVKSPAEHGPQVDSAMVVLGGPMKVVGDPGGWGWTSVACGSDATGWVNLVVYDYGNLVEALQSARGSDSDTMLTIDEMLATPFDTAETGLTFGDIIADASHMPTDATAETALTVLEQTASAWEALFWRFGITAHNSDFDLMNGLMYSDDMQTYDLLEDARFLDLVDPVEQGVTLVDVRIASALSRLRTMTSAVALGNDVDKRCWGAIEGHIERRPAMRDAYARTEPKLPER